MAGMAEKDHQPLIPCIPDDMAMECLLRIPHRFHSTLKLVCHGWRSLLSQASLYSERRRLGAAEHLICLVQPLQATTSTAPPCTDGESTDMAIDGGDSLATEKTQMERRLNGPPAYTLGIYNVTRREWQRIALLPTEHGGGGEVRIPMFCQVVALPAAGKVLLLGGWDPDTLESVRNVYVIDLIAGSWQRGAPMGAARSFFAVAVAAEVGGERVYVAGGHDGHKNALRSAEVYDVETDEWAALPPMAEERDECLGMSCDGAFMVISGYATDSQGRFRSDAEWFLPETGRWSKIDDVWPSSTVSPRTTAVGAGSGAGYPRWWWVIANGTGEVKEFYWEEMRWSPTKKIPILRELSGGSSLCVTDMGGDGGGDGFFVVGDGGIGGNRVFVVEGKGKIWKPVQAPPGFCGFPFSASHLLI